MKKGAISANNINLMLTIEDSSKIEDYILDVLKLCNFKYRLDLAEEALLCITANLIINYFENKMTIISGDDKFWLAVKGSGCCDWASLDRVNTILNTLIEMGYIGKIAGYYSKDNPKDRYRAKYYIRRKSPIIDILDRFKKSPVSEKIKKQYLSIRDKDGNTLNLEEVKHNKKKISRINACLKRYNNFIKKQNIDFRVSLKEISEAGNSVYETLKTLLYYVNTNKIELKINDNLVRTMYSEKSENYSVIIILTDKFIYLVESIDNSRDDSMRISIRDNSISDINVSSIHGYISEICYLYLWILKRFASEKLSIASNDKCLASFHFLPFFDQIILSGSINFKQQTRIFNNSSFELGGRFYGGAWNNLPKVIRKSFTINGEPVSMIDFDGIHIRMLYHLKNKQFLSETYVYDKKTDDRDRMKLISLIMINAENSRTGTYAINDRFKSKGLFVSSYYTRKLIKQFKDYHSPIKEYLFSGIGIRLQNYDSEIMLNILNQLTKNKIPALSVHDEVIVPKNYEEKASEIMISEYEKIMGYLTTVS